MNYILLKATLLSSIAILFCVLQVRGQVLYKAKDNINLSVSGTSTLHNWEMKSDKGDLQVLFSIDTNGKLTNLNSLKQKSSFLFCYNLYLD